MDNNFNNDTNDINNNINSGFEAPSSDNPLNLEFEEPYVQTGMTNLSSDNLATVKPKKSRKWLVPTLAGLGVAVAACVCSVLFIPQVNNFFKLHTQNPTSYYQDIEKDNIKETIENRSEDIKKVTSSLSTLTGEIVESNSFSDLSIAVPENAGGLSGIKLTINDGFKDFVHPYIGQDGGMAATLVTEVLKSVDSLTIDSVAMVNKEQQVSMDFSFTLNENNIISANAIIDLKNYVVYFTIPEVTDTVFSIKIPERVISEYKDDLKESLAMVEMMYGKLDQAAKYLDENNEEFLEFIEKYTLIVVDSMEDAELSKNVEVDVNEVVVEYTEIVVKIDEKMANKIGKNVIEELKDDEFAMEFAAIFDVSEGDYDAAMAEALDEIESADTDDEDSASTINYYTYVNNKGEIVGRGFGDDEARITYVTYEKDDTNQFQLTFKSDMETSSGELILRGKSTGEDSKSGNVILEFKNEEYDFDAKCEYKDCKLVDKDLCLYSGNFTFTTTFPELEPFAFVMDLDAKDKLQTITMDLLYNDEKTVTLELSTGYTEYKEIKIPSNTLEIKEDTTPEELLPVLKKLKLTTIKANLKKALNSETLNSTIDALFTEYGLDVVDGDMTDEELEQLIKSFSNEEIIYEDDEITYEDDDFMDDIEDEVEDDERTGDDGDPSMFMDFYLNGPQ